MQGNRYLEQARKMLRGMGSAVVAGALASALMLGGCTSAFAASPTEGSSATQSAQSASAQNASASTGLSTGWYDPAEASIDISGMDFEYGKRESSGEWSADGATTVTLGDSVSVEGDGASVDGSVITITAAGTYVISGTSANAQVVVNAGDEDKVQIVLNGASITNESAPALLVLNADKVFVTTAEGTQNALSDTSANAATLEDESLNAAVYSKDDICFNGSGSLAISGNAAHAVKGKDDVVFAGGTYTVTAVQDGIRGKESVKVTAATLDINAGSDGIQTSETDDANKGFVSIDGGQVTVKAGDDGIQASRYLRITGGTVTVSAADDALHSDIDGLISGGTVTLDAGDDAFHTEFNLGISGGTVKAAQSYEGLEGQRIVVADGTIDIASTDDAFNASQGSEEQDTGDDTETAAAAQQGAAQPAGNTEAPAPDASASGSAAEGATPPQGQAPQPPQGQAPQQGQQGQAPQMPENASGTDSAANSQQPQGAFGGRGGGMGGGMMEDDGVSLLVIEGGTLTVSAAGDALDSNGDLLVSGGTLYVSGPENDGNASLDYGGEGIITGGTVIAAGSAGMAQTFGSNSTQASILAQASGQAGDTVSVVDESGAEVVAFKATKAFTCVIAAAPNMTEGASYKVLVNGAEAASATATTQQSAAGFGGGAQGFGDRGDAMGGTRGQNGMGPRMQNQNAVQQG